MKKISLIIVLVILAVLYSVKSNGQEENKTTSTGEPLYFVVEELPEFPGGEEALKNYIAEHVKYPEEAKKNGISGKVFVTFTVSKEGKVMDAEIAKGKNASLDQEALRVINDLPDWTPGKQKGKAVNVQYTLPINFALENEK